MYFASLVNEMDLINIESNLETRVLTPAVAYRNAPDI